MSDAARGREPRGARRSTLAPALTAHLLALLSVVAQPQAATVLQPLPDDTGPTACNLRANSAAPAPTLLVFDLTRAVIHVDARTLPLAAREERCHADCVAPGRTGVRVFHLSGKGVQATLRKRVACARDAEDCGGLPAGPIHLTLAFDGAESRYELWHDHCDL